MIRCANCGDLITFDACFCAQCGAETNVAWPPLVEPLWNEAMPESENIHWLGQCRRRLTLPLDDSEATGLSAFEYAWKAFNNLYDEAADRKGMSARKAKEKMNVCLKSYLDCESFVRAEKALLDSLCTHVLNDDVILDESLLPVVAHCRSLRCELPNDALAASRSLVRALYVFRNSRTHGSFDVASQRVGSTRTPVPVWVISAPQCLLALCTHLIAGKTGESVKHIRAVIESRSEELIRQIVATIFNHQEKLGIDVSLPTLPGNR